MIHHLTISPSQALIELNCRERSNLSGVPQCQPPVHEGHEGKVYEEKMFLVMVMMMVVTMITFWLPAETVSKDGHKRKIAHRDGGKRKKGKFQRNQKGFWFLQVALIRWDHITAPCLTFLALKKLLSMGPTLWDNVQCKHIGQESGISCFWSLAKGVTLNFSLRNPDLRDRKMRLMLNRKVS